MLDIYGESPLHGCNMMPPRQAITTVSAATASTSKWLKQLWCFRHHMTAIIESYHFQVWGMYTTRHVRPVARIFEGGLRRCLMCMYAFVGSRKFLEIRYSEFASGAIFGQKQSRSSYYFIQCLALLYMHFADFKFPQEKVLRLAEK